MKDPRTFVIVGAGLAGAKAAQTLRDEGFDGDVVLLGEEPERPYERPPLSKGLLLGTADRETVFVHEAGWYAEHDVDLRTGVGVAAIDRAARQVELADGQRIRYDALLLATGSTPRPLDVPGSYLDGVQQLRTLADSDRIADPGYGQAYADAIPGADFEVLPQTGHLPQLESPDLLLSALRSFSSTAGSR